MYCCANNKAYMLLGFVLTSLHCVNKYLYRVIIIPMFNQPFLNYVSYFQQSIAKHSARMCHNFAMDIKALWKNVLPFQSG